MNDVMRTYLNWNTWLMWIFGGVGTVVIVLACVWERFGAKPAAPAAKRSQKAAPASVLPPPLQAWLKEALSGVPGYEERDRLRGELTAHLQETMEQFSARGLDEAEAAARTLENVGPAEAFVESWHRENDKPLPWRLFLGASAGMAVIGAGLLTRVILRVRVLLAAAEPGHVSGTLTETMPQALAEGNLRAALGSTGGGTVIWLLLALVFLIQGIRGWRRTKQERETAEHV